MLSLLSPWLISLFSFFHPFYVSVIQVDHNAKENSLEISARIFTEDLENTLRISSKTNVDLLNPKQKTANDKLIYAYFQKHLKIAVNGKPVSFEYVGFEKQSESVWTYLEVPKVDNVKTLDVTTDILYEFTDKQENIIQAKANNKKDSYRLTAPKNSTSFVF